MSAVWPERSNPSGLLFPINVAFVEPRVDPRAARRWLTWLSVLLAVVGTVGLFGGFEDRTYAAPPEFAVGDDVGTTRFTYRVQGATWTAPTESADAALRLDVEITNTSRDSNIVPRYLIISRLPDGTLLPSETTYVATNDGPSNFLPLITTAANLTYREGVPGTMPDEIDVFIFDESVQPEQGVYTESFTVGGIAAQVSVPVEEGN